MAQDDAWEGQINYSVGNQAVSNVIYFAENASLDDFQIQQFVDDIAAAVSGVMILMQADQVIHLSFDARRIEGVTTPSVSSPLNNSGVVSGDMHPSTLCSIVRHYSRPPGRAKQGRYFVSGIPEAHSQNGRLTANAIQTYSLFIDLMKNQSLPAGGVSIRFGHWSPSLMQFFKIESMQVRPSLTVLKSRQMRR